jgi:hypothetical protein
MQEHIGVGIFACVFFGVRVWSEADMTSLVQKNMEKLSEGWSISSMDTVCSVILDKELFFLDDCGRANL